MALPLSRAALVRVAPFALFMVLLALRGAMPADGSWGLDPRWLYGVTVLLVGSLLLWFRQEYGELSAQLMPTLKEALLAVAVGVAVFVLWIQLDAPWMTLGEPAAAFAPVDAAGNLDWPLIAVRWIGAALLVPVMEELFWRSFLMRWLTNPMFLSIEPRQVSRSAFVITETELKLIAAAASMGESSSPKNG
mgnify:CR=1 FL=1